MARDICLDSPIPISHPNVPLQEAQRAGPDWRPVGRGAVAIVVPAAEGDDFPAGSHGRVPGRRCARSGSGERPRAERFPQDVGADV